jgi:hypothetical protein
MKAGNRGTADHFGTNSSFSGSAPIKIVPHNRLLDANAWKPMSSAAFAKLLALHPQDRLQSTVPIGSIMSDSNSTLTLSASVVHPLDSSFMSLDGNIPSSLKGPSVFPSATLVKQLYRSSRRPSFRERQRWLQRRAEMSVRLRFSTRLNDALRFVVGNEFELAEMDEARRLDQIERTRMAEKHRQREEELRQLELSRWRR